MPPTDDLGRWSDELASDPASLVFLRLGEALRRQGELVLALKVALRGLERHPNHPGAQALVARIAADRAAVASAGAAPDRESASHPIEAKPAAPSMRIAVAGPLNIHRGLGHATTIPPAVSGGSVQTTSTVGSAVFLEPETDPPVPEAGRRFPTSDGAQALLIDDQGLVLAGSHRSAGGHDVGQELAARLAGVSEEARRAAQHLKLGAWRSLIVETDRAVVALAPVGDSAVTVVTGLRSMPLGMLRRVLRRCERWATDWTGATS